MALDTTFGPYQSLPFAGIHLDSRDMSASLPEDKIVKFINYIQVLLDSRTATLKQVQSVVGMFFFFLYSDRTSKGVFQENNRFDQGFKITLSSYKNY